MEKIHIHGAAIKSTSVVTNNVTEAFHKKIILQITFYAETPRPFCFNGKF